jgi:hypothetical protein
MFAIPFNVCFKDNRDYFLAKSTFKEKDMKNQIVGFKCSMEMLKRINDLAPLLSTIRAYQVSSSKSDVIREALAIGLRELESEIEDDKKG